MQEHVWEEQCTELGAQAPFRGRTQSVTTLDLWKTFNIQYSAHVSVLKFP